VPRREREPEELVLTDPRALRALAHPARTAVIDALYSGGERTASELAALTGLTPSAMSYHLRALEKWGIVRRSEGRGDQRERPWKRAARGLSWSGETGSAAVNDAVAAQYLDRLRADLASWDRLRGELPEEWSDLGTVTRGFPLLTADEVRQLDEVVRAAVSDLAGARTEQDCPPGARRVAYFWASVPVARDE
jgi:DNA-binding transcriptional ArsR family regulator